MHTEADALPVKESRCRCPGTCYIPLARSGRPTAAADKAQRDACQFPDPDAAPHSSRPKRNRHGWWHIRAFIHRTGRPVVPADTAVERMGLHGIDPASPEFRGSPFTHTFLYGYHAGRLVFVEPMVTLAYLKSRADVTVPVKRPSEYTFAGYYPSRYRVGFDAERDEYRVALLGLRAYGAGLSAAQ